MGKPLRFILVEDTPDDAELLTINLIQGGYEPQFRRVETAADFKTALSEESWDLILCDYVLPHFDALAALEIARQQAPDLPFIVVSGKIGEEVAVETMLHGAHDYIMKNNLQRLCAAIERELAAAKVRVERRLGVEKIFHLNQILQSIRNINQLIVKEKRREILIQNTCELLTATRGYDGAWIALIEEETGRFQFAQTGYPAEAFTGLIELLNRGERPQCCRRAFQEGALIVTRKQPEICGNCPLVDLYGREASLTTCLIHEGRHFGVFSVCLSQKFAAMQDDLSLFEEIAGDLAFALHNIDTEKQRDEAYRIINLSPAVAFLWQNAPGWPVEFVTENAREVFGYTAGELTGGRISYLEMIHPEDSARISAEVTDGSEKEGGESFDHLPYRIITKQGEIKWVDDRTVVRRNDQGVITHFQGVVQDITQRIQAEEERKQLEAQLRQQQKLESIGTLASGVAHEINNPITAILNFAELIQMRVSDDAKLQDFSKRIIGETNRISKIVKNLLSFARQEKEHHSPAYLSDIIDDTLQLIAAVFRRDNITVQLDIPADLPKVNCRSHQIQQVIMNLLTNARDALNERYEEYNENKVLIIQVRPFLKADEQWVRTTIEDHGPGIDEKVAEKIFDPFFTTKGREKGTGLGLSISHGIVRDHGGILRLETKKGHYTKFHLELKVNNDWKMESTSIG